MNARAEQHEIAVFVRLHDEPQLSAVDSVHGFRLRSRQRAALAERNRIAQAPFTASDCPSLPQLSAPAVVPLIATTPGSDNGSDFTPTWFHSDFFKQAPPACA
jgi:hypothetical protein